LKDLFKEDAQTYSISDSRKTKHLRPNSIGLIGRQNRIRVSRLVYILNFPTGQELLIPAKQN